MFEEMRLAQLTEPVYVEGNRDLVPTLAYRRSTELANPVSLRPPVPSFGTHHSGAARIPGVRMRPLTLQERGLSVPTVSLADLLTGERAGGGGSSQLTLRGYTREVVASALPGPQHLTSFGPTEGVAVITLALLGP